MALLCTAGHATAGARLFFRPIRSAVSNDLQAGVLTGMWHLITIHFALSAAALFALGALGGQAATAWLIAAQFAGYALTYLLVSLRLGGLTKLFQWLLFACTALLAAGGAAAAH